MSERVYVHQAGHKLPIHVPALHHTPSCGRCEFHKQTGAICISPEGQPGGLLIVSDYPGQTESQYNRPLCGQEGQYLRGVMLKHWFGNWALTSALGCKPTGDVDESHIDACRPYLAKTIADVQPELIMLMGPWAGLSFFGEKYQPLSTRGGHGWWQNPVSGKHVPVATMISPSMAIRNTLVAKAFEADFREVVLRYNERTFSRPNKNLYVEVVDMQNVSFVLSELEKADYTGFDTETSGLMYDPTFRIESIVLWGVRDGVITRGFLWDREQIEDPILREPLGRALASSQIRKVGFNSKYDIQAVLSEKLLGAFAGFHSDARIKRKLLAADAQGSLAACSPLVGVIGHKAEAEHCVSEICADLNRITKYREYCSDPSNKPKAPPKLNIVNPTEVPHTTTDAIAAGHEPEKFAYRYIPRPIRRRYNALDVLTTVGIEEWANERIGLGQFLPVWEEIAAPATLAMVEMEQRGILVDRPKLQAFSGYLGQKIKMELTKLQAISPDINPASPKQVSEAIGKLGLKIKAKTASGGISTSETALEALKGKHIFIDSLLEWRRLSKLKSTYADGYQIFIRGDSRIHTSYLLDGTECMPAGELVLTSRGYLQVEKVRIGDMVLTHTGRPQRVEAVSTHPPAVIYEVNFSNGLSLRTTANHPYRVGDEWIAASDLEVGSWIAVHSDMEKWAPIEGWPEYIVSSWGRVHSLFSETGIAPQIRTKQGHLKVTLKRNGARKRGPDFKDFQVHRLVLKAFGGSPKGGQEARHLNGIAWDNTIGNLSWGSSKENKADQRKHGTVMHRHQQRPEMKLTEADVSAIRAHPRPARGGRPKITQAVSDQSLAKKYGVTREMVRDIRTGKKWQPVDHPEGKRATFHTAQVVSINILPEAPTYGLTVVGDASHVTGGVVTHNTGRPSSSNPNMSVLPRNKDAEGNSEGQMLRDCFVAKPDHFLLEVDRKQIEIYIAAYLSKDPKMMEILMRPNADFHMGAARMCSKVAWSIEPDAVTKEQRQEMKTSVFAVLYELPDKLGWLLSKRLKCSVEQGEKLATALFGNFDRLKEWMMEQLAFAQANGYAQTEWRGRAARQRMLWGLGDTTMEHQGIRDNAKRSSWNGPVQGTSADLTTADLLPVQQALRKAKLRCYPELTIYDSIIFEVHEDDLYESFDVVRQVMTRHDLHPLKLGVDGKYGKSLGSMVDLKE